MMGDLQVKRGFRTNYFKRRCALPILKKLAVWGCVVTLVCAGTVAAQADLIIDTGPVSGGSYTGGNALYKYQWLAGQFSLTQSYTITQVLGLIGYSGSHGGGIKAVIRSDVSGLPGVEVQHQSFTTSNPGFNTWQGTSGLSWDLQAGTYWLAFEVDASSTFDGAMTSSATNPLQHYAVANTYWRYGTYSAPTVADYFISSSGGPNLGMMVYGDPAPVPLPGPLFLLGAGLLRLAHCRRRTVTSTNVSPTQ
jgi:hypothetical protein